ncbi:MAG: hypothetical protein IT303_18835 [Dehalococcoidia bacterium]|nr:hypothetical protein [Dehalococcoidia bacterium]
MAGLWFDAGFAHPSATQPVAFVPLAGREVGSFDPSRVDPSPGRRLRVFATLVHCVDPATGAVALRESHQAFITPGRPLTYLELYETVANDDAHSAIREALSALPLRLGQPKPLLTELPESPQWSARDPDLPPALQDLGDEINEDIREALDTLDNPESYYPGIDSGIAPVTDEHVKLVIWAMQRELNRELRPQEGHYGGSPPLPAAPLEELQWPVQRALAERRRLRFSQWGIFKEQWEKGAWSLWDVPLDPEYVSRRAQRLYQPVK